MAKKTFKTKEVVELTGVPQSFIDNLTRVGSLKLLEPGRRGTYRFFSRENIFHVMVAYRLVRAYIPMRFVDGALNSLKKFYKREYSNFDEFFESAQRLPTHLALIFEDSGRCLTMITTATDPIGNFGHYHTFTCVKLSDILRKL